MKKNYTISIPRARFWTVIVPLAVLTMLLGGLAGVLIVDRMIMPRIVGISTRGIVDVPDLAGVGWQEARQMLYDIGLRLQITGREYSEDAGKGVVLSQVPEPGEKVKKGRHICVVVGKGSEVAAVPEVKGLSERLARRALRDAGFAHPVVHKVWDEKAEKDQVVGTDPPAGIRTSRELPIDVRISKGPRPTHASVPNVIGELLSEARRAVEENGLKIGNVDYRSGTVSRPGTVISQSHAPGTSLPLDGSVDLVVAAGR
ncbi:MAG: PASTA domain-containing protein [Chitinivibrionales bacterium]|nr:PASTA domain-containing protein [Chitinivibrionales bacterium]MBD3395049.1 PASTA domain-containing protein [Chitinivibrionales bacterium]